ncbi:MAG: class I SAM-dependent methyltransferase [Bacteroidales bacterium]|jgi:predicted SAM-dependent methyltransferase|nr:class I SAM-dependent methyltransferase [Bacteroidales bacterium]
MKRIIKFFLQKVQRKYLQKFVKVAVTLIKPLYLGNKVMCPVCGKHYRKFLPYGYVSSRENALCPNCLSLERHRLLWLYFNEMTDFLTHPYSFLHIAPELCFVSQLRKTALNYQTADLESPWADLHFNIENIPIANESYDIVMANHILEHVDNLSLALKEIHRILRPGGRAVLLVPLNKDLNETFEDKNITDPLEREKAFGQRDHLRMFGNDYPQILERAGFDILPCIKYIDKFSKEERHHYGLCDDGIFIGVKH